MEAVRILMYEHYVIKEFLDQLALAAEKMAGGEGPDRAFFDTALSFCRDYADKAHHYKEEHVMFGLLASKHEGRIDAQIESHRNQHEQLRSVVSGMSGLLNRYAAGDAVAKDDLRENLEEYVRSLRKHIASEDEIFFPMVEVFLTPEEGEALLEEFEKYGAKAGVDYQVLIDGHRVVDVRSRGNDVVPLQ